MPAEKQDANFVGLFIAREVSNSVLPVSPVFYTREPNSFDDLGGEYKQVARKVFTPSRQRLKGGIVDLDSDGGFQEDLTQNNMQETMEAFFFAAMRRKGYSANVAAVTATDDYTVDSSADFKVGDLVLFAGFDSGANNGLKVLNGITDGTHISVADNLVDEAANAAQTAVVVGHQFAADDVVLSIVAGKARLTSAAYNMTNLGLIPGEWVFVGGQAAGNQFGTTEPFYGRVSSVVAGYIELDKTTGTIVADDGAGTTLQLFMGYLVKNEDDPDLIVKYTHTLERTLGRDDDGVQSENIPGFVFNEMTWNSPLADKVTIDIKGMGMRHRKRTGAEEPLSSDGAATIIRGPGEDFFNTSTNVYRIRLSILDAATLNPSPLFARVTEWNVKINNNMSANKAQGTLGAFDTTAGTFDVDGEFTAYFSTLEAAQSIEDNADVTFDAIYSKKNAAIIMDIPLLGTGGGRLKVEQDQPIMLPLTIMGAESDFGHTASITWLPYVPNVGMASG